MSAYDELVQRCVTIQKRRFMTAKETDPDKVLAGDVSATLAEVLRTLRTCDMEWEPRDLEAFRVMLDDTPLVPPDADSGG